jgi:mannosyltransferase OCH1-like enzyme
MVLEPAMTRIPRVLHRTVPEATSPEVESWWTQFQQLHPGWALLTWRDPLQARDWPLTSDLWGRCQNGAQKAGLVRLEALVTHGGVYVDSDVRPFRSFEPLLHLRAFAAWEDETTVPDAVLGAEPGHPAFVRLLERAREVIEDGGDAWDSGPGITTEVLPGRSDVLVLPPGAFYEVHYLEKSKLDAAAKPYEFARHMWHGSWLTPSQRAKVDRNQRGGRKPWTAVGRRIRGSSR